MRNYFLICTLIFSVCLISGCSSHKKKKTQTGPGKIEILFLGHESEHHNSARFAPMLASVLSLEGINLTYTDQVSDLNPQTLGKYDGLIIYANHEEITASQEEALLNFVEEGKGFIPVHCASFCFLNSPKYIELVGGQFLEHKTGTFTVPIINKEHPAMRSVKEFTTWDETYVHHKLTDDRTVLMERVEGDHREPWTWVKEYGKGRVFYTAYGHDERTWNNPGFHQLMKEGILWAVGDQTRARWEAFRKDMPSLVYKEVANIPNYEKRDPAPKYQEPLSPEESKKLIQVPVDFELQLFASEPDIINPIAMDWDEKGRLWVIETVDYPNTVRQEEGIGDDRVKICEDTDGDGKADKFTVFADNLNIPTSLVFANGGIIVSQAPHFLFLKDTNGDDKADVREILIEGWGTFDTHAGPSNLKYGIDNQIWGVVGYSGFNGTIAGRHYRFKQGIYHFAPDISSFEVLTGTSNNTWGLGFTANNNVFASTANNTHSVFMGIPDRYFNGVEGIPVDGSIKIDGHYAMHPITRNVRQVDVFGGFTAASGHNFYTAQRYPEDFWNKVAFVCEPTGHLVHMARIEKNGAGFVEKDGWNLFAGADEWVSPVEAKVGPDGAVWVLDWYNFIVQHNPTPTPERGGYQAENGEGNAYVNPLRDKSHGRVWRVVYKGAKPYEPIQLEKDNPKELLKALSNGNMFWRITAQRLLVERGKTDVLPELYDLVERQQINDNSSFAAIHALWTIHGLGAINNDKEAGDVVAGALEHSSPGVRKAAIQVLPRDEWANHAIFQSNVLNDADANTRLTAILALAEMEPSKAIGRRLYELSEEKAIKNDNWLSKAVYVAATTHRNGFITAFLEEHPDFNKNENENKPERKAKAFDDSAWKDMELPQYIEQAGLNLDGVVWFRKTVNLPGSVAGTKASISLGAIDDSDETYINGVKIGETKGYDKKRVYKIPVGILKPGKNIIAVKVEDTGGGGGFYGEAAQLFIEAPEARISLSGNWKYEVTEEYNSGNRSLFQQVSIAEVFTKTYLNKAAPAVSETPSAADAAATIHIKVVKNEMKYNLTTFTVEAGKPVEIVLENPDFMQHNLVITEPGAMEKVGEAADKLAMSPKGAEMQYVPDMPEVLFYTRLVNPEETVRLTFTAPEAPGSYPYICTFPGHWRIMQGVMKVVKSKAAL